MGMLRIELITTELGFLARRRGFRRDQQRLDGGNDEEALVIDVAHQPAPILEAIGGRRRLVAIVCTHGHNDHINAASAVAQVGDAPVLWHPDDRMLWDVVYPDWAPPADLVDGGREGRRGRSGGDAHAGALAGPPLFLGRGWSSRRGARHLVQR